LEGLFAKLPRLRPLYEFRVRFQAIFDTASGRRPAHRDLVGLFLDMTEEFPELDGFVRTFEAWQEEILNYFDAGQTSGPVEGINNKARVITKRTYGLKSAQSLWNRLILDLNRASEAIGWSIEQIRQLAKGLKVLFDSSCT
jgi:transposase